MCSYLQVVQTSNRPATMHAARETACSQECFQNRVTYKITTHNTDTCAKQTVLNPNFGDFSMIANCTSIFGSLRKTAKKSLLNRVTNSDCDKIFVPSSIFDKRMAHVCPKENVGSTVLLQRKFIPWVNNTRPVRSKHRAVVNKISPYNVCHTNTAVLG